MNRLRLFGRPPRPTCTVIRHNDENTAFISSHDDFENWPGVIREKRQAMIFRATGWPLRSWDAGLPGSIG